jgi:plasmid stabilization system protein ParE
MTIKKISLEVLEDAAQSILDQIDYYREQSPDSNVAARWEAAVTDTMLSLLQMPERGTGCRFRSPRLQGMRWIPVHGFRSHFLFYIFVPDENIVRIVQVIHGSRDSASRFSDEA